MSKVSNGATKASKARMATMKAAGFAEAVVLANSRAVLPGQGALCLDHLRAGGHLFCVTSARVTVLSKNTLARFEKAGAVLIQEEGEGYRMASGKSSVYLFPGQLRAA